MVSVHVKLFSQKKRSTNHVKSRFSTHMLDIEIAKLKFISLDACEIESIRKKLLLRVPQNTLLGRYQIADLPDEIKRVDIVNYDDIATVAQINDTGFHNKKSDPEKVL